MGELEIIETQFKVFSNVDGKFVPFKLFDYQKRILNSYKTKRFNIVKKYRQGGVSSITQGYLANKGANSIPDNPELIAIICNKLSGAQRQLKKIKEFLSVLPRETWGPEYYGSVENEKKSIFIIDSKIEIELPNGSKYLIATHIDSLKGYRPTCLFFDEAAFIDKGIEMYEVAINSLDVNGQIIMVSTPNGSDNFFYKVYRDSLIKRNNFHITNVNWWEDTRFGKNITWHLFDSNDEIIDTLENVTEGQDELLTLGYMPTNEWFVDMCRMLNYNQRQIEQEICAKFIF